MLINTTSYPASISSAHAVSAAERAPKPSGEHDAVPPPAGQLPPLKLIQGKELPQATADFAAELADLFRSAGISTPPDPVLSMDYAGNVVVANGHHDAARIERLFEDVPHMRDSFAKLSSAHLLQRAVEGYDSFVANYESLQGNTAAQAALLRDRIAHNNAQFFMSVGAEGAEPFFGGLGRITA